MIKYGRYTSTTSTTGSTGTNTFDTYFGDESIPIKSAEEPNLAIFESGYEHTFGKILHIKRQLDFDNTKYLSIANCNQNKSLLKQHNIKQQPILYRKHGVDNRR